MAVVVAAVTTVAETAVVVAAAVGIESTVEPGGTAFGWRPMMASSPACSPVSSP